MVGVEGVERGVRERRRGCRGNLAAMFNMKRPNTFRAAYVSRHTSQPAYVSKNKSTRRPNREVNKRKDRQSAASLFLDKGAVSYA